MDVPEHEVKGTDESLRMICLDRAMDVCGPRAPVFTVLGVARQFEEYIRGTDRAQTTREPDA